MSRARRGKLETLQLSDRVKIHIRAAEKSVAYHTYDLVAGGVLHESYLAAGEDGVGRLGHGLDPGSHQNSGLLGLIGNQVGENHGLGGLIGNQVGENHGLGGLIGNQLGEASGIGGLGLGSPGTGRGVGNLRGRRARALRVLAGRVEVRGPMDRGIVRRIVRRHINEVRHCYRRQLQANPLLRGRVVVQFTIAARGQVVVSRVGSSTLGNAEVEQCIAAAVRRWLFPGRRDRGVVVVSCPFVLGASGGRQGSAL
jgi:hypothetical protein